MQHLGKNLCEQQLQEDAEKWIQEYMEKLHGKFSTVKAYSTKQNAG